MIDANASNNRYGGRADKIDGVAECELARAVAPASPSSKPSAAVRRMPESPVMRAAEGIRHHYQLANQISANRRHKRNDERVGRNACRSDSRPQRRSDRYPPMGDSLISINHRLDEMSQTAYQSAATQNSEYGGIGGVKTNDDNKPSRAETEGPSVRAGA